MKYDRSGTFRPSGTVEWLKSPAVDGPEAQRDPDVVDTVSTMLAVVSAMCCTPGAWLNSRYSSIWLLRLPSAGSLIGNLIFPSPSVMTLDMSAEYSVEMSSSEKWTSCWKPSTRS
jgi:hypothetical protein